MNPQPALHDPCDEDARLVTAVQSGDVEAFEPLVERHLDSLHAFVSIKLPIPHLIDELTHETLVFAFHHIADFTAGTSFRAWLRAIAVNRVRTAIERYTREERNRLAYAERQDLDMALAQVEAPVALELDALNDCLSRLPEHLRHLVRLRYEDESSSEEIAGRLERSVAWVRTTLCRVRQQLRDCIDRRLNALPS